MKVLSDYPKDVIQRWARIKLLRKMKGFTLFYMRPYLIFKDRKRKKVLNETFETVKDLAIKFQKSNFDSSNVIINIALFILLAEKDIQAVKIDALTHPDKWKRNLSQRTLLLIIHEWDLDKVTGKNLKNALENVNASEELKKQTYIALRKIRKAQKHAKKQLGFLRNATIAHRDPDALLQYRSIRNLDEKMVLRLSTEFYEGGEMFMNIVPKLILETGSLQSLFKQVLASEKS